MFIWASGGLSGLVVSALNFQAGCRGFESRSGRDNFQTTSTPSSYSTCPGFSIKWTGRRLVTDSGIKCARVIQESKAVQIHVYNKRRCLYAPRVPGSVKNPRNNIWASLYTFIRNYSIMDYLNILVILELNPEFRDFKLWDQKLLYKGFVLEILVEYF